MKKIFLALLLLAAGAGAFHAARQYSAKVRQGLLAANESWQSHTRQLAAAQAEHAALAERIRELRQMLAQSRGTTGSAVWTALQTNRADQLPPELRRMTLEELGFDWRTSPDFVIVTKQAVREVGMLGVRRSGQLTDAATGALALTPEERSQVAAAMERVKTDLTDWLVAHLERKEPADDVLAHYTLPKDTNAALVVSRAFAARLAEAVGRERTDIIMPAAREWMQSIGVFDLDTKPALMRVIRRWQGDEVRLSSVTSQDDGWQTVTQPLGKGGNSYPRSFHYVFPNGWQDIATREGFELPAPPPPPPPRKNP